MVQKIALGLYYNGADYQGWQRQSEGVTVQGALESALSQIAGEQIRVICAGRTDAGVHALGQVIHFETTAKREMRAWLLGTNANLPTTIRVQWAQPVATGFHARFSARRRHYRYIVYNHPINHAIMAHAMTWCYYPLDVTAMHRGALQLLGTHDFSSFRSSQCQAHSPKRQIDKVRVHQNGRLVILDIVANAFLHHMVRNIMGVLFEIGRHRRSIEWMSEVLQAQDRRQAANTAKPEGLYLMNIEYPPQFSIPVGEIDEKHEIQPWAIKEDNNELV